jgi:hypothetical protein
VKSPPDTIIAKAAAAIGHTRARPVTPPASDVPSLRKIADRAGFWYHAILHTSEAPDT